MSPADEMIIDLSNYKDRVGSRVAPGRYRVQVEDTEAAESNAHNPMVNLWLRIMGGQYDGSTIVDRLTITDKSMFRVVGFMQAIGLPTPKQKLRINIQQFRGKVLEIDVVDGEPYNSRIKSEVRSYYRIEKTQGAADDDEVDEFAIGDFKPESDGTDALAKDLPGDDGLAEFSSETTSNPSESPWDTAEEATTNITNKEDAAPAEVAAPVPTPAVVKPEEDDDSVDLDSIDI
jgi:hypothetical protein